jgi:dolichol-phosphate mannosyltransferase
MVRPLACIVLPTFNEAENARTLLPEIFREASRIDSHEVHVLVVDDNSQDGTSEAVRELMRTYPNLHLSQGQKKGLGEAYKRGMGEALVTLQPDLILQMDADLQHDPSVLPLFVTLSNHGFSLVIGSRFAAGGATTNFPWHRKLISLAGTRLVRLFGGLPYLTDCTSGYRCIKADLIARCNLKDLSTRGYSFQSSLLCELMRNGARVIEVPIIFGHRKHGQSKLALRDQTEFVVNLFRLRFKALRSPSSIKLPKSLLPGQNLTVEAPSSERAPVYNKPPASQTKTRSVK